METNVNIPLLRKAVEWAEAEAAKPAELREWEQNWWVLTPEERQRRREAPYSAEYGDTERAAYYKAPECGTSYCIAGYVAAQQGCTEHGFNVAAVAADALGIDLAVAESSLFEGGNTIEDVRRIAESLAGERL